MLAAIWGKITGLWSATNAKGKIAIGIAILLLVLFVVGMRSCALGHQIQFKDGDQLKQEEKLPELFQ